MDAQQIPREVEITPKMVKAGVRAITAGHYYGLPEYLDRKMFVTEIYRAMRAKDDSAEAHLKSAD